MTKDRSQRQFESIGDLLPPVSLQQEKAAIPMPDSTEFENCRNILIRGNSFTLLDMQKLKPGPMQNLFRWLLLGACK